MLHIDVTWNMFLIAVNFHLLHNFMAINHEVRPLDQTVSHQMIYYFPISRYVEYFP